MYLNSGRVSAYKSWDAQLGTRIYTQNYIEFTKIDTNSQQNTKKSQKITENHIEIQKIHNISMKITYNPTKKTSLGGSRIEKFIYIYIYIYYLYIISSTLSSTQSLTTHSTYKEKKFHSFKEKNKKKFLTNKKNFFQKKKNFSKKNLLQTKKIHSFKRKK